MDSFPPSSSPLRVLLALPRSLLTLLNEAGEAWQPAAEWIPTKGQYQVSPLQRSWTSEAIESALQVSGVPLVVRVLHYPTRVNLRAAVDEGYDVLIVDTYGTDDGTLYFEGSCGESHPISPVELGALSAEGGVRLLILLACPSIAACKALHKAGVPAVVGIAEKVREDAVRAYLDVFLEHLAGGDSLEEAHGKGRDTLQRRWETRLAKDELPHLATFPQLRRSRLVEPGLKGAYVRLHEPPIGPRPPALSVRVRGRAVDQVLVQQKLLSASTAAHISPLVTLHGFDGMGKSTLALSVAHWFWERVVFPGGVHFVRLPDRLTGLCMRMGEPLIGEILQVLAALVPEVDPAADEKTAYRARVAALCAALGEHPRLLVLDNFETCGTRDLMLLAELRERCPGLHILLTSHSPSLGLAGERSHALWPLAQEPAVELFRDRALDAGKMLLHAERTIVSEVCDLLDCVPLHIRLVASHMRAGGPPTAILDGLRGDKQHCPVTAAQSDDTGYSRSQELAFCYVYNRLSVDGRRLWMVMAGIFAGEPGRAAVRDVYGEGADPALDQLLMWSVVESVHGRHRMAAALRQFGRARLAGGELGLRQAEFRRGHAAHHLAYAREHKDDHVALELELPDILAGFAFAAADAARDDEMVRDYALSMSRFFYARGLWAELDGWSQDCIRACERLRDQAGLAAAYGIVGLLCMARGQYEVALEWYEKSTAILEALDDIAGLAAAYNSLGLISEALGATAAALAWYGKSASVKQKLSDWAGVVKTRNHIGLIYETCGDYDAALASFEANLALCRRLELQQHVSDVESMIAEVRHRMT